MFPTTVHSRAARTGLTLLELLLVLALVVVLFAMAVPRLTGASASGRLRIAGDQLRAAWGKTRNTAMRDGAPRAFVYLPDTRYYATMPADLQGVDLTLYQSVLQFLEQAAAAEQMGDSVPLSPDTTGAGGLGFAGNAPGTAPSQSMGNQSQGMGTGASTATPVRFDRLPEEIVFATRAPDGAPIAYNASAMSGQTSPAGNMAGNARGNGATPVGMPSGVVLFRPDGSCDDSIVWLLNTEGDMLAAALRGLTGGAELGDIVRTDFVPGESGGLR